MATADTISGLESIGSGVPGAGLVSRKKPRHGPYKNADDFLTDLKN
jgi:hypothetical protein